jgi:hypothetical protein
MTIVMGIDPGISGAVAFYFPMVPSRIAVDDVPVAGGEINGYELARLIRMHRPTLAVIERVEEALRPVRRQGAVKAPRDPHVPSRRGQFQTQEARRAR